MHSFLSELEETIKRQVEDVLACVDQRMAGLRKEHNEKIDETQADVRFVMTSIDKWTGNLEDHIPDAKKDCHKAIVNTRKDLHEELGLMFQLEVQTTKALVETT
jgi:hypothetical protein